MNPGVARMRAAGFGGVLVLPHDDPALFAELAAERGLKCIIAGAGGAAHLPGMLAAKTTVPVLGVPVASRHLQGVDSLHSIVQMPKGVPVAPFAIGPAGAFSQATSSEPQRRAWTSPRPHPTARW